MTKEESANTESVILDAAREVFVKNGFDGARMQDIADKAGINKALLHYYYRSKENLFEKIFAESFGKLFVGIRATLSLEGNLEEFIRRFVSLFLLTLKENPYLPNFVIHEVHSRPERMRKLMLRGGIQPSVVTALTQNAVANNLIYPITGGELMMSMIGVCVIPVIGRPIYQSFFFEDNSEKYDQFLKEREKRVLQFIFNAIYINPPKA